MRRHSLSASPFRLRRRRAATAGANLRLPVIERPAPRIPGYQLQVCRRWLAALHVALPSGQNAASAMSIIRVKTAPIARTFSIS